MEMQNEVDQLIMTVKLLSKGQIPKTYFGIIDVS